MIEAVTFDFWNTLMYEAQLGTLRQHRVAYWVDHISEIDAEAVAAAHDVAHEMCVHSWKDGNQYVLQDAAALMRELLGAPVESEEILLKGFIEGGPKANVVVCDGAEDCLRELKAAGLGLGIICDVGLTPSPVLTQMLEGLDLLRYFDVPLFSDQVGIYKPDIRIFKVALERLGVAPHAAFHIGDRRRTDVAGARAAGLKAARYRAVYDDNTPLPDADIVLDCLADSPPAIAGFT